MTLYLDVSSLARWTGPAVGIARVEHALAQAARLRPDTVRVLWHAPSRSYRRLNPDWAETILGWHGAIDTQDPTQSLLSRHRLFTALERLRLTRPGLAPPVERLQDALLALRPHGHRLRDGTGRRIAHLPPAMAIADAVAPGPGDTVLSAGSDWSYLDPAILAETKRRLGFRYARLCYDLIPITHPQFYFPRDVASFTRHWRDILPLADHVICNAACIAADIAGFCAASAIAAPDTTVLPLGYDAPSSRPGPLPEPLRPGRYALFVSTIEPRKGHAMLLRVWRRLVGRIPQDFRLVLVGRPGWMVDALLADLGGGIERVHHLQNIDDAALSALYDQAAFALYPSAYEGFGLPVIEAFARGKPVLASTGGALPETVAGAYPCLPPDDEAAWETAIAEWIARPPPAPRAIHVLTWPEAAAAILDHA